MRQKNINFSMISTFLDNDKFNIDIVYKNEMYIN